MSYDVPLIGLLLDEGPLGQVGFALERGLRVSEECPSGF
jgi:hypothetical protein